MTLARAIAEELKGPCESVVADDLTTNNDLLGILSNVRARQVLAVSDIDAIRPPVLDDLVEAVLNYRVDILVGVGRAARKHSLPMPRFTLIGTTTRPWLVQERLRRWCVSCQFGSYTIEETARIVQEIAEKEGIAVDIEAASDIALQCGLRPGEAAVFLRKVATYFPVSPSARIDRRRLRELNEFFGAGALHPEILQVADQVHSMSGTELGYKLQPSVPLRYEEDALTPWATHPDNGMFSLAYFSLLDEGPASLRARHVLLRRAVSPPSVGRGD